MDQYSLLESFINHYFDSFDVLKREQIEFHGKPEVDIHAGSLSLMLAELMADRYGYAKAYSKLTIEELENEKKRMAEMDRTHPGPEHGPRRHYINAEMAKHIPVKCTLLDFGCGGGGIRIITQNAYM